MEIKWKNLKISIPYIMGQLSEKKVSSIVENLKENGFDNAKLIMANPSAAAVSLEDNKKSLIIEPQQITYSMQLEDEFPVEKIQSQFEAILNSLFIDDRNQFLFNIEGISETEDSHTDSKKHFEEKYMTLDESIYGVGYRFLIKNEKLFGEFKIEPLVSDKAEYYYQWLLNKADLVTIADVLADVKEELERNRESCYSVIRR